MNDSRPILNRDSDPASASTAENPYAPPTRVSESTVRSKPSADQTRSGTLGRGIVLTLLGLSLLLCGFVLSAAIWELVTMSDDAYGQHRWLFRRNYYLAGLAALAFGALGVVAWVRIRRHQRFGQLFAACAIVGVIKFFLDIF